MQSTTLKRSRGRFYHRLNRLRRVVQISSLVVLLAIPILNGWGFSHIRGTLYALSIGPLEIIDPALLLQTTILTHTLLLPLLVAAIIPVVLAFVFGRVFCSWLCPHNTLSEWITSIEKKFFRKRWRRLSNRRRRWNPPTKLYLLLLAALIVTVALSGLPLFNWLSTPGLMTSAFSQLVLDTGAGAEIIFVVMILAVEAAIFRRFWCKYACPVGVCLGLLRTKRTLQVTFNQVECNCKAGISPCERVCPLDLVPKDTTTLYPSCFNCGLCIAFCENAGHALEFGARN